MDITKRIIDIREQKRIKQIEIAEKLSIDRQNYSRLEKRGDKLTIEQLKQIAGALGVGINELLEIETPDNENVNLLKNTIEELSKLVTLHNNTIKAFSKLLNLHERVIVYLIESELYGLEEGFKDDEMKISKFKENQMSYNHIDCIVPNPKDVDLEKFPTTQSLLYLDYINMDDYDFNFSLTKDILKIFKERIKKSEQDLKSILASSEWLNYVKENNL